MVEVWLPYGRTEVCARVPTKNLLDIIEPNEKIAAKNPQAEIENALASPLGTKRLADSAKPGDKVSIVLRDFDTSTNHMMASAILKELNSAGIEDADVTVIVAYDPLHRSSTKEELPIL
ncbi:MAG: lactate racemase domain-containing protein, partial [Candidatus Bathyarchaeota archaeon]|nr:lactate racemase domain-containing protein [Candidatus Bathyarchaeota archaeon]